MKKKRAPRLGLFGKISVSVSVIIALVICAAALLSIEGFSRVLLEREWFVTRQTAQNLAVSTEKSYNFLVNQMTIMMNTPRHVGDILIDCTENPQLYHDYANIRFIIDYLQSICVADENVIDAILVTPGNTYSYSKSNRQQGVVLTSYDFPSLPYLRELAESERGAMAFYDEAPPYVVSGAEPVISLAGKLYNRTAFPGRQILGYLMLNYSPRTFDEIHRQFTPMEGVGYLIANSAGQVIYSNRAEYLTRQLDELEFPADARLVRERVGNSGIQVAAAFSNDVILPMMEQVVKRMILIFAASAVLILLVSFLFYRGYKRRIAAVTDKMLAVSRDGLRDRLRVDSDDELGRLALAFNQMCEELDKYIELNYKAELARKTAELNALQAQINPHFLFNTIESIRMRALLNRDAESAEMLAKLGHMFHWMIQFDSHIVYLEDEVEYITSYLYLQKTRFDERLESRIEIPGELMYLGIPKFTLQPVVENAIRHGMKQAERILVTVDGEAREGRLELRVRDDGPGIPPERLEQLNRHIADEINVPGFGIGLRNVHLRLRMLFGDGSGLRVECPPEGGTLVRVSLPALRKKEMEVHVSNDHRG